MTRTGTEQDTKLRKMGGQLYMTRTGTERVTKKETKPTTKTGIELATEKKGFTKVAPDIEGYYWVIRGKKKPETACIYKVDTLNWGTYWRIMFIGDSFPYTMPHAEQVFELEYGSKCS